MALGTPCSTTELRGRLARSATRRDHCPKLGNVIVRSVWRRAHAIAANCTAYSPLAVRLTNSTARPVSIPRSDRSLRSSSAPNSLARVGAWRWRSSAGWSSAVRSGAHGGVCVCVCVLLLLLLKSLHCTKYKTGRFLATTGYVAPSPNHVQHNVHEQSVSQCIRSPWKRNTKHTKIQPLGSELLSPQKHSMGHPWPLGE